MALKFGETKGKAASNKVDAYEYKDGEQTLRIFGDILPRYMYWLKGTNNKNIPVECLAFNRDKEKFDNMEVDHVPSFYPDIKCSWSYAVNVLDPKDGTAKALNLKKKLFMQIIEAAEELGDPTDPETGWDIVFKRVKTGAHAFNVEYTLQPFKCKKRALTAEELQTIANHPTIESKYPRPTAAEVKANLEKIARGASEDEDGEGAAEGSDLPEEAKDL